MHSAYDVPAYQNGIVKIFKKERVIGTGFYLRYQYLITCAHVVRQSLDISTSTENTASDAVADKIINIKFAFWDSPEPLQAQVLTDSWRLNGEDVVLLKLLDTIPAELEPGPIRETSSRYSKHEFEVFGHPNPEGDWAEGVLNGPLPKGWVIMRGTNNQLIEIQGGYSGAPVWDRQEGTIVGIAVATKVQEDEEVDNVLKKGYMIPYRRLRPLLESVDLYWLLDTLEPHLNEIEPVIHKIYRDYHPDNDDYPTTLIQTLRSARSKDKLPHVLGCLLIDDFGWPDLVTTTVEEWFTDQGLQPQAYIEEARQNLAEYNIIEQDCQSHLIFWVQRATVPNKYFVQAWLIQDAREYSASDNKGCVPIDAPSDIEEPLSYLQLDKVLQSCLEECKAKCGIKPDPSLTIELFLPIELLDKSFVKWNLPQPKNSRIAQVPESICSQCKVVIRAADRLLDEFYQANKDYWKDKWEIFQTYQNHPGSDSLEPADGKAAARMFGSLNRDNRIGLYLSNPSQEELNSEKSWGPVLFSSVAPIVALWPRHNPTNDNCETAISQLVNETLSSLPEKVRLARNDSSGQDIEDAIGHHLSLLWENPLMIPPPAAQGGASPRSEAS